MSDEYPFKSRLVFCAITPVFKKDTVDIITAAPENFLEFLVLELI